jgi:6-pyruvoyltetrahydropterin/6-carboxytetrahydropterin synthase
MISLSRTVRFCLNGPTPPTAADEFDHGTATPPIPPRHNGFSAWPAMRGLGRYYQLRVCCDGDPDPATGYFISIKHIDRAVSTAVIPYLQQLINTADSTSNIPMGHLMRQLIDLLQSPLKQTVTQIRLDLTPYYSLSIRSRDMDHVLIRQQYDFAAAHRLHTDQLSEQENQRVFGKCNNPSGHGHNYRLEVAVKAPINPDGHTTPVETIDALIDQAVIQKLDHKHLNLDVPQFAQLNPSVEHIAMVIYGMIAQQIGNLGIGVEIEEVSVWETDKTVCTYRGPSTPETDV